MDHEVLDAFDLYEALRAIRDCDAAPSSAQLQELQPVVNALNEQISRYVEEEVAESRLYVIEELRETLRQEISNMLANYE